MTPAIDDHQAANALLGERFLSFRPRMPDRVQLGKGAAEMSGQELAMRTELQETMHGFLHARGTEAPTVSPETRNALVSVADLVTRGRSPVKRDSSSRDLLYAPEPEAPTSIGAMSCQLT